MPTISSGGIIVTLKGEFKYNKSLKLLIARPGFESKFSQYMTKMSLSFPRMRESISSSGVFPLQALIPAFARMTKLEHFIFCHVQR